MDRAARQHIALPATQRGVVVLLMLLILAVSAASYFLVKRLNGNALNAERDKITAAALVQARDALIGRAASDSNRPGELPCPDVNNDGQSAFSTTCTNLVGRLPWYTLRLPDLRDGYGERLWYALVDNFHAGDTLALNTTTTGRLSITGTSPANNVIAIVFSPGPALGNQSRDSTNVNSVANYLEGDNANLDTVYETRNASDTFNDKLLPITHSDLFSVVTRRVTTEISAQLASFVAYNPFPDTLAFITDSTNMLVTQNWTDASVTSYTRISLNEAQIVFSGCAGVSYIVKWDAASNQSQITKNGLIC